MYLAVNKTLAYAKVNLYLKVVGKLDNGYHNLEMLNTSVDFYDELEIMSSDKNEVEMEGIVSSIDSNIVLKIIEYISEKYHIEAKTKIKIKKNIFIGAGLAGGSTDAASTIKLMNDFYELKLSRKEIKEICLKFGSDIYFCYYQNLAKVYGTGDKLKKVLPKRYYILLVNPGIELLTKNVFNLVNLEESPSKLDEFYEAYFSNNLALQNALWANDLEKAALKLSNELAKVRELLSSIDENFHLTGAGSTYFLLSDDYNYLKEVQAKLPKNLKTVLTKTI